MKNLLDFLPDKLVSEKIRFARERKRFEQKREEADKPYLEIASFLQSISNNFFIQKYGQEKFDVLTEIGNSAYECLTARNYSPYRANFSRGMHNAFSDFGLLLRKANELGLFEEKDMDVEIAGVKVNIPESLSKLRDGYYFQKGSPYCKVHEIYETGVAERIEIKPTVVDEILRDLKQSRCGDYLMRVD